MKWVHSKAMLADVLTKSSTALIDRTATFLRDGFWRLVEDPLFLSARKRTERGIGDLEKPPADARETTTLPIATGNTLFAQQWGLIWHPSR